MLSIFSSINISAYSKDRVTLRSFLNRFRINKHEHIIYWIYLTSKLTKDDSNKVDSKVSLIERLSVTSIVHDEYFWSVKTDLYPDGHN